MLSTLSFIWFHVSFQGGQKTEWLGHPTGKYTTEADKMEGLVSSKTDVRSDKLLSRKTSSVKSLYVDTVWRFK